MDYSQKSASPAQKGVYIHSKAAELLKTEGRTTIVATDLLDAVSKVITVGKIIDDFADLSINPTGVYNRRYCVFDAKRGLVASSCLTRSLLTPNS